MLQRREQRHREGLAKGPAGTPQTRLTPSSCLQSTALDQPPHRHPRIRQTRGRVPLVCEVEITIRASCGED